MAGFLSYFMKLPLKTIYGWSSKEIQEQYHTYNIIAEKVKEAKEEENG